MQWPKETNPPTSTYGAHIFITQKHCRMVVPLSHFDIWKQCFILLPKSKPIPMNLLKKLTRNVDQHKLVDAALLLAIVVMTVIYKMNKM